MMMSQSHQRQPARELGYWRKRIISSTNSCIEIEVYLRSVLPTTFYYLCYSHYIYKLLTTIHNLMFFKMMYLKSLVLFSCLLHCFVNKGEIRVEAFHTLLQSPITASGRSTPVTSFGVAKNKNSNNIVARQAINNENDNDNEPTDQKRAQLIRSALSSSAMMILSNSIFAKPVSAAEDVVPPLAVGGTIQYGKDKELMFPKAHGTTMNRVQSNLRFGITDDNLADRICSYNRNWAEYAGYYLDKSNLKELMLSNGKQQPIVFYDR
jgi:hypothetical protein